VNCGSCREINEIPTCEKEKGCIIPPLDERGQRIMEIKDRLITLKELLPAEVILKMYKATMEDVEMLAALEEELKKRTAVPMNYGS